MQTFSYRTASPLVKATDYDCNVTVVAPSSIQAALDGSSTGDVICLSGTFHQSVIIGPEDSDRFLQSASVHGVLDGRAPADDASLDSEFGIKLLDGASKITIRDLVIEHCHDARGSSISAWDVSTSDMDVRRNTLRHNTWNGILVGSEGGFIHEKWKVWENTIKDNGFVGAELTNCRDCEIVRNTITDNGFAGVVIQARNTIAGSGLVTVDDVRVKENVISDNVLGVYILSREGGLEGIFVLDGINPTRLRPRHSRKNETLPFLIFSM